MFADTHTHTHTHTIPLRLKEILTLKFLDLSCRRECLDFAPASMNLNLRKQLILPHKMPLLKF
jgi:hypothetical protein